MTTHTITTTAYANNYSSSINPLNGKPDAFIRAVSYSNSDMKFMGWTKIGVATITVEVDDSYDYIDSTAKALKEEIAKMEATAYAAINEKKAELAKLLVITNEVTA